MTGEKDEYTPRERGLLIGNRWAGDMRRAGARAVDHEGLVRDPLVEAAKETPVLGVDTRDLIMVEGGMRERLDASEDPDAESAFWAGFRDGVRAYLVVVEVGGGAN